jgi:hypothetical protein
MASADLDEAIKAHPTRLTDDQYVALRAKLTLDELKAWDAASNGQDDHEMTYGGCDPSDIDPVCRVSDGRSEEIRRPRIPFAKRSVHFMQAVFALAYWLFR